MQPWAAGEQASINPQILTSRFMTRTGEADRTVPLRTPKPKPARDHTRLSSGPSLTSNRMREIQ
ncbi:MAG TPA: hypothetical protein VJ734_08565 [Nitrosospira sp.]|nr:hypothetical protein [Nitrosospira sp.]